jgi:hypothetical protein
MQKNSNSDYDGQITNTAPLQIGRKGLDLRQSIDQSALTVLNNARFTDATTVEQRTGHTGVSIQDGGNFPFGLGIVTNDWTYGYGVNTIGGSGVASTGPLSTKLHYPIHNQALATFNFNGNDVVWTGDRLLTVSDARSTALGGSSFWWNTLGAPILKVTINGTTSLPYGMPCFLPSLVDYTPPSIVNSTQSNVLSIPQFPNSYDIAISPTQRAIVYTNTNGTTSAQIIDRATNSIISENKISTGTSHNNNARIVYSGGIFVAYWGDSTGSQLYTSSWDGVTWSAQVSLTSMDAYDIATTSANSGYLLVYRVGAVIKARYYIGKQLQQAPFGSDTIVTTTGSTPSGPLSVALSPNSSIGVMWYSTTGYFAREFSASLATKTGFNIVQIDASTATADSCSIVSELLPDTVSGTIGWTTYAGYFADPAIPTGGCRIRSMSISTADSNNIFKFNCSLASRAFRVGNVPMVWLRTNNSPLYFLAAGVADPIVCGYADRGEAGYPFIPTAGRTLPELSQDPLDPYKYAWSRPIAQPVNGFRYSDIDFLPQITTAQYGSSFYLSGSAVTNFDGTECSDAGFQDFPVTTGGVAAAGGSLTAGLYQVRVYAVRYNNLGERFVSQALTSGSVTAAAAQKITWSINSLQSCTSQAVQYEVYRTTAGGTTFFLDGTVQNNMGVSQVTFASIQADSTLGANVADPYQSQLGGLPEAMNTGAIGCTTIVSYNDRLWCSGGQVPTGQLVFSKLKIAKFGAGFDALAGSVTLDSEGGVITSIIGMNDSIIAFESNKIFVLQGDGPDNFRRGGFPAARFAAAKGAITHFGTLLTDVGVVYWNEGGPHLFTSQYNVQNISDVVRPLATTLIPVGARINPQQQEVIWYTNTGTALLWDYKTDGRWATWSGLYITSVSTSGLTTTDAKLLTPNSIKYSDAGQPYVFSLKTSQLRTSELLEGYSLLKRYGMVGTHQGPHQLEIRIYYNGSPLWEEDEVWLAENNTYLAAASTFGSLNAAQFDALEFYDKSGNYATHRRAKRQNCQRFQIELLDNAPDGPSFSPQSLEFELGERPGLGRTPITSYTDK